MGLYGKLFSIFQEVGGLSKDLEIPTRDGNYRAVSEAQVLKKIRPLLIKHGVMVLPTEVNVEAVAGGVTTISTKYMLVDVESEEQMIVASAGQGKSSADKGMGMAMTYAEKYLYLKMLKIITGEDADNIGDYQHETEAAENHEKMEQLYKFLLNELELMRRGTLLKNEENYSRIKGALVKMYGRYDVLKRAESQILGIKEGTTDPDTVAAR
jgi:hypothetical protein